MRFYVVPYRQSIPSNAKFPCVQLTRDSWNDFGYVTLFTMTYHATKKKSVEVGSVKILRRGESSPKLESPFNEVPDDCCSLGQSLDYYKTLSTIPQDRRTAILRGLRDVVHDPALVPLFESDGGWKTSLLRFSEAELALKDGRAALDANEVQEQPILFTFQAVLKGASAPFVTTFRFSDTPTVPSRIMALVGKNGAGKTWFLSRLAAAVSGDDPEDTTFAEQRPPFSRAIAVSYSALDRFRRPGKGRTDRTFSYHYCGIYDDTGRIAPRAQMFRKMRAAFETVRKAGHEDIWSEVLADVLDDGAFTLVSDYLRAGGDDPKPKAPPLSSGQLVLASTLTGVIAVIEPASLLLYDEPELHLHPNAIAGLMRAIERLLSHFRSYAVIATHSPMILQQVPSRYVRVFTRLDRMTTIEPLGIESFGQNLTVLTEQIFKAGDTPSRFRDWSRRVSPGRTLEEIQAGFEYPLSFEAKMFLRADRGAGLMPRLVPVEIGEATHLNAIIEGKRAPARPRLRVLKPALETRYIEYAGTTTAFHSLAASTLVGTDAEYCVGCYNLDRPTVAALKRAVLDARPPNRNYLCQWCLIEPWGEMDHYVPKESFPEFAVMARNLAPCCSKCNKAKGDYWPPVGVVPEVLNLYYSSLLDRDHLSAAVTHAPGGASAIQFAIRRDVGLTPAEIATLEVHYARLRLMPRLQDAGISALSRFRHSLRAHGVTRANAVQYLVDEAVGLATAFGANHYEALTATALAAAPAALDDYLA